MPWGCRLGCSAIYGFLRGWSLLSWLLSGRGWHLVFSLRGLCLNLALKVELALGGDLSLALRGDPRRDRWSGEAVCSAHVRKPSARAGETCQELAPSSSRS